MTDVAPQGAICLDTLKQGWTPVLGIKTALLSLQSLLAAPEPKDPQDAVVASQMISRPEDFKHKAREWAIKYAGAPAYDFSGGSGGATAESLAEKGRKRKEEEQKASMAQYVLTLLPLVATTTADFLTLILLAGIVDIIKT